MPHAKLSIDFSEFTVPADGGAIRLPVRRLRAWASFGRDKTLRQALLDTGCPVCTIPKRFWTKFDNRGDITWVADPPATVPTDRLTRTTVLLGGRYPYRLGRINVVLADLGDGQLTPRDVSALCIEDTETSDVPLLLGLAEVLNGRSLLLQASESGERWAGVVNEP